MSSPHNPHNIIPYTNADKPESLNCGKITQVTPRDQKHVLGGLKRCKWLCRFLRNITLRKGVYLGPIHMVLALISPCAGAAISVTEMKGCIEPEKSQTQLVVHVCVHYATQGLWPHSTTTHASEISKATDACSILWRSRETWESTLKLILKGKGKLFLCFDVLV
jgi:hypothetical protein